MKSDFEAQKQALLGEIRTVLDEVENLYQAGAERSAEETQELKNRLQARLGVAQSKLQKLETRAVEQVKHQPPMNTLTKNRITPWALPRWRVWWWACCSTANKRCVFRLPCCDKAA